MNEPWRDLQPGDKVRIVRVPSHYSKPGCNVWEETVSVYQSLVNVNAVLTIRSIDQFGNPWTEAFDFDEDGQLTISTDGSGHILALNDDSWEWVSESLEKT